jgi:hypothetical protein
MRVVLRIVYLVLFGWDAYPPANPSSRTVLDSTGTNQLALVYYPSRHWSFTFPGGTGLSLAGQTKERRSLIWRTKNGTNWSEKLQITDEAFQAGHARPRWISEVHSLNPAKGVAVIKVAEDSAPRTNGGAVFIYCDYSWREWSLLTNGEVRLLRMCNGPSEKY